MQACSTECESGSQRQDRSCVSSGGPIKRATVHAVTKMSQRDKPRGGGPEIGGIHDMTAPTSRVLLQY